MNTLKGTAVILGIVALVLLSGSNYAMAVWPDAFSFFCWLILAVFFGLLPILGFQNKAVSESLALNSIALVWSKSIVLLVAVSTVFRQDIKFSRDQSDALAVFAVITYQAFSRINKHQPEFTPFWIHIRPWWGCFLEDHGVVDEAGWKRYQEAASRKDREPNTPYFGELMLTILAPKLFYDDGLHRFFSKLHVETSLDKVWPEDMKKDPYEGKGVWSEPIGPSFCLRETYDEASKNVVLEFSLITPESIAHANASRKHEYDDDADSKKFLPLARLPKDLFAEFYGIHLSDKRQKQLSADLEREGWTNKRYEYARAWEPDDLEHKYLTICYGGIEHIGGRM